MRPWLLKTTVLTTLTIYSPGIAAEAARFVDLNNNSAEKYINQLSDQGVINAEPDGKFLPNQSVTRAMLAYWLVKVMGLGNQPVSDKPSFADVKPTDWFYKPVEIIRQNNYISGYADGFRPNQFVQKSEVLSILARTLNTPQPDEQATEQALCAYNDKAKIPAYARTAVAQTALAGLIVTPADHLLNPTAIATRADAAVMLCKLSEFLTHRGVNESEQIAQAASQRPAGNATPPGSEFQAQAVKDQFGAPGQYLQSTTPASQASPGSFLQSSQQAMGAPPQYSMQQPQQQTAYVPQTNVMPNQFPTQQSAMMANNGQVLQGNVTQIAAGTRFQAKLDSSLDSGSSKLGDRIEATITEPIIANGAEVIPAGSRLIGQITKVESAKHFKFGANGSIGFKFSTIETTDGRKIPLQASIADKSQVKLVGGSTAGRVGKGLGYTGVGAGGGALVGATVGAVVASARRMPIGMGMGMGALFGGAIGGGAGAVTAGVAKGSEVRILSGTDLPMRLDQGISVTVPPMMQSFNGGFQGGFPQGGFQQDGSQQGGFQQNGFQQQGSFPQQGGFQQGGGFPSSGGGFPTNQGYQSGYPTPQQNMYPQQ
jgi:hypothetical protein